MITLYYGTGARDFRVLGPALHPDEWAEVKNAAVRLLRARGKEKAAEYLAHYAFQLANGTNHFGDEFTVLHVTLPLNEYAAIAELEPRPAPQAAFKDIAATIEEIGPYVRFIAAELDTQSGLDLVAEPSPSITTATVERALRDAQNLLTTSGPVSALDRAHTALHGYMRAVCSLSGLTVDADAGITQLFKALREHHPAFADLGPQASEIQRVFRSLASVIDSLNNLRNRATVAHPNEQLLRDPEAVLALNAARTVLHYLDARLR